MNQALSILWHGHPLRAISAYILQVARRVCIDRRPSCSALRRRQGFGTAWRCSSAPLARRTVLGAVILQCAGCVWTEREAFQSDPATIGVLASGRYRACSAALPSTSTCQSSHVFDVIGLENGTYLIAFVGRSTAPIKVMPVPMGSHRWAIQWTESSEDRAYGSAQYGVLTRVAESGDLEVWSPVCRATMPQVLQWAELSGLQINSVGGFCDLRALSMAQLMSLLRYLHDYATASGSISKSGLVWVVQKIGRLNHDRES